MPPTSLKLLNIQQLKSNSSEYLIHLEIKKGWIPFFRETNEYTFKGKGNYWQYYPGDCIVKHNSKLLEFLSKAYKNKVREDQNLELQKTKVKRFVRSLKNKT